MRTSNPICAWCPDTLMVWSRVLDDHICPDCRGSDCTEEDAGE